MNIGVIGFSVIPLLIGGWLWWHRDAPRATTTLFLVAGFGIGGGLGNVINTVLTSALGGHPPGEAARGVGLIVFALVVGGSFAAVFEVLVKGVGKSRQAAKPKRWHPWVALALPTIVIAAGVPFLAQIADMFAGGFGNAGSALMNLRQR